jgi:ketosteroid isomerase-like protein
MNQHSNVGLMQRYLDTYAEGNLEGLMEFFAPDVLWHVAGTHPLAGDYRGKDELLGYFRQARDETAGSLKLEPAAIMASDDHIALFLRVTGERAGRRVDVEMAQAFTVDDNGKLSEFWSMADDQDALDEFWA